MTPIPYENQGFEHSEPDYVILGLDFIGTCGSFPEQYDVVMNVNGVRTQVGYIRLRGGNFYVYSPDINLDNNFLYHKHFENGNRGSFDSEELREEYLTLAASLIQFNMKRRHVDVIQLDIDDAELINKWSKKEFV